MRECLSRFVMHLSAVTAASSNVFILHCSRPPYLKHVTLQPRPGAAGGPHGCCLLCFGFPLRLQVLLEARMAGTLLPPYHRATQAVRRVGMRIAKVCLV